MINPYDTPQTVPEAKQRKPVSWLWVAPVVVTVFLSIGVIAGLFAVVVPGLRSILMPRFGWIGLIIGSNPLIFLFTWFYRRARQPLIAASFMCLSLALINAATLIFQGTVSSIQNEFSDRFHSSWFWSVFLFAMAGGWLYWTALFVPRAEA